MQPPDTESTTKLSQGAGDYELLVAGDGRMSRIPLPKDGTLLIGRGGEVDVSLAGNGVSRRHALLRISNSMVTLEDLGSSNGTSIRGQALPPNQPVGIAPGESLVVGEFVLVLRARRALATTRRVLGHEYFEARVSEQCERARDSGGRPFYLLGIRVEGKSPVDPTEVVAAELEPSDVLARLAPNEWAVLLLDENEEDAAAFAAEIDRALEAAGCRAQTGIVGFPRDGTSSNALFAKLEAELGPESVLPAGTNVGLRSPPMLALYREIDPIARGDINVLILGETGVGKDVLARRIHERSERASKPFLRINCAALPEPLLESELFGHERGAFTGAVQAKLGLLQTAQGGSVFLDEIGELPQRLQAKLLQVLETREILALGSTSPKTIDVRFLAATNRDLEAEALSGQFRSDLYYRVAGYTAVIPPLRERREDILPLAQEFARTAGEKLGAGAPIRIRDDAAVRLIDYAWPGNVRELRNIIERAVVLSEGRSIGPEHLPLDKMRSVVLVSRRGHAQSPENLGELPVADLSAAELAERQRILDALSRSAGNQSKAAEILGVSRSTLLNRLDAYRIKRPRKRPG
jgi:DNA-binding NtrC family response regulator